MFTTRHAASQHIGSRTHQADATAHHHDPDTGRTAWVLLDGIGDHEHTAAWVRTTAPALAALAARRGDPVTAIGLTRSRVPATVDHPEDWPPDAAAVVAVLSTGGILHIAWAGDCRAYLAEHGRARLITTDHNEATDQRRAGRRPDPDAHDYLTSSLCHLHGAIDHATVPLDPHGRTLRLLLASDGAYLPHEHAGTLPPPHPYGSHRPWAGPDAPAPALAGTLETAAQHLVDAAVNADPSTADNATVLLVDLHPAD
ncbi:PP2C family serine/threonine-protein phosphatase [Kitasatospora sp. NPDC004799]|uniref:PP2C family protein-serine/threonine phosphatase n=1 Tax=Kitasatospora sp. NPDC004799 TaxID=3154460 RepID=UPI0033A3DF51